MWMMNHHWWYDDDNDDDLSKFLVASLRMTLGVNTSSSPILPNFVRNTVHFIFCISNVFLYISCIFIFWNLYFADCIFPGLIFSCLPRPDVTMHHRVTFTRYQKCITPQDTLPLYFEISFSCIFGILHFLSSSDMVVWQWPFPSIKSAPPLTQREIEGQWKSFVG